MRIVFSIIIGFHGLVHLLGFAKAFGLAEVKELTLPINKSFGILWLFASLLLITTVILYFLKSNYWWIPGIISVILSQFLIIYFWKDARFGTIPNIILLFIIVVSYANFRFEKTVQSEVESIHSSQPGKSPESVTEAMLKDLPEPVKKWLEGSGIIGKECIHSVHLRQQALMKLKPEQKKWTKAQAEQYFIVMEPGFIWTADMSMMPLVPVKGKDKFQDGKGQMLIKVWSLFPVVNARNNEKINEGSLQRFLAEIVWFPSAALSDYITWEEIDDYAARATMSYKGVNGSGTFYFDKDGNFEKLSAMRYRGEEAVERTEWIIEPQEIKVMNGIKIPVKTSVTWKLDSADWTWLKITLTELSYNHL